MRRVRLALPALANAQNRDLSMLVAALQEIERASYEDNAVEVASAFVVTNYTPTRTLDAGAATTSDIANFLCTFVADLKRGGAKKG